MRSAALPNCAVRLVGQVVDDRRGLQGPIERGIVDRTRRLEHVRERLRVDEDHPVDRDARDAFVECLDQPPDGGRVRVHVQVPPEPRAPEPRERFAEAVGRGRRLLRGQVPKLRDVVRPVEVEASAVGGQDRVRAHESSGTAELCRRLRRDEISALPLGSDETGQRPGQGVGRRRRSGRLFELGDRPIACVRDGTHDPGRRQRPHAGEGGLELGSRVADRGMERLDLFHGDGAVGRRELGDPAGKPLDPVRQVRAGRGGEPARVREHDDRVEGAAGEGDRPCEAQDRAPRVAARLVERVLRSAERGGRRSEVPRQQQLSSVLELVSAREQARSRSEGRGDGEHAQDQQDPGGDQDAPAPPPVFSQAPVPGYRVFAGRRHAGMLYVKDPARVSLPPGPC